MTRLLIQLLLFSIPALCVAAEIQQPLLRIGVSSALTGPASEFGGALKNGILLAQSEHPEQFEAIEFYFEDDQYDAATAVRTFQAFRSEKNVDLIFVAGVTPSEAMAPLAERYQLPLVANCQNPSKSLKNRYVIRFINYTEQYIHPLWDHLRSRGLRKLTIVKTDAPYYDAYLSALLKHKRATEEITVIDGLQIAEQDFRSVLLRIKQMEPEAIGVFLFPGQLSSFYRQAATIRLSIPTFGTDVFESRTELARANGLMDGAIYPFHVVDPGFVERYKYRFGGDNQIGSAANGYDFAMLLAQLSTELSEKPTAEQLLTALRNPKQHDGVTGRYQYKKTVAGGQFYEFPIVLKHIVENDFQELSSQVSQLGAP